eukprot:scaffold1421_cov293-Prasinococcus_capsulatus_cf.AAC.5
MAEYFYGGDTALVDAMLRSPLSHSAISPASLDAFHAEYYGDGPPKGALARLQGRRSRALSLLHAKRPH